MLKTTLVAAALALGVVPGTAQAWIAGNGLIVEPTGQGSFHIPWRGLSGTRDFWCAAGDYVERGLGLRGTTRIYRTSRVPRRAGEGIDFSLSPEGARATGLVTLSRERGVRAAHAALLCDDALRKDD